MPTLTLKKLTTTSFQGIDSNKPVVIDFTEYAENRITKLTGDQGVGKTSTINSLLYACGQTFDFKLENFININDGTLSGSFEFEKNGKQYKVTYSKTKFTLNRLYKDADEPEAEGKWIPESDPKELLRKLIGHVAISPMELKSMKGPKQVEWLFDMLSVPKEVKAKQDELNAILKNATTARTEANKTYTQLKSALSQDDFYLNWEQTEKLYIEEKGILSVKEALNEADKKRQQLETAKTGYYTLTQQLENKNQQISDLETKIVLLKQEQESLVKRVDEGRTYIEANEPIVKESYNKTYKEFTEINNYVMERNHWLDVVKKKKEMDEFETAVQELDVRKKDTRVMLQSLIKGILPDIKGLEIESEEQIDSQRPVGIYIDGKTPAQLSESELFDFNFQVCISQGISMAFIENISSFGSATIDTLNRMAEMGIWIFATMVDRRKKSLGIEISNKID